MIEGNPRGVAVIYALAAVKSPLLQRGEQTSSFRGQPDVIEVIGKSGLVQAAETAHRIGVPTDTPKVIRRAAVHIRCKPMMRTDSEAIC